MVTAPCAEARVAPKGDKIYTYFPGNEQQWSRNGLRLPRDTKFDAGKVVFGTTPIDPFGIPDEDRLGFLYARRPRSTIVDNEASFPVRRGFAYYLALVRGRAEVEYRVYEVDEELVPGISTYADIDTVAGRMYQVCERYKAPQSCVSVVASVNRVADPNFERGRVNEAVMRIPQKASPKENVTLRLNKTEVRPGEKVVATITLGGYKVLPSEEMARGSMLQFLEQAADAQPPGPAKPTTNVRSFVLSLKDFKKQGSSFVATRDIQLLNDSREAKAFKSSVVFNRKWGSGPDIQVLGNSCGNEKIEKDEGEQCDFGKKNGTSGVACTITCRNRAVVQMAFAPYPRVPSGVFPTVAVTDVPDREVIHDKKICEGSDACLLLVNKTDADKSDDEPKESYVVLPYEVGDTGKTYKQYMALLRPDTRAATVTYLLLGAVTKDPKDPLAQDTLQIVGGGQSKLSAAGNLTAALGAEERSQSILRLLWKELKQVFTH